MKSLNLFHRVPVWVGTLALRQRRSARIPCLTASLSVDTQPGVWY